MNKIFNEYLDNVSNINRLESDIFIYKGDIKDFKKDIKNCNKNHLADFKLEKTLEANSKINELVELNDTYNKQIATLKEVKNNKDLVGIFSDLYDYKKELSELKEKRKLALDSYVGRDKSGFAYSSKVELKENTNLLKKHILLEEEALRNERNCTTADLYLTDIEVENNVSALQKKVDANLATIQTIKNDLNSKIEEYKKEELQTNNSDKTASIEQHIASHQQKIVDAEASLEELKAKNKVIKKDPDFKTNAVDRKTDKSFFQKNNSAYRLILFGVLFESIYTILLFNRQVADSRMFLIFAANVGLLLFSFTTALSTRVYKKSAIVSGYVLIVYLILRVFVFIPFVVEFDAGVSKFNVILLSLLYLGCTVVSTFITKYKIDKQNKYKQEGKISFAEMSK